MKQSKCVTVCTDLYTAQSYISLAYPSLAGMAVAIYEEEIGFDGAPTLTCALVVANHHGDVRQCRQSQPMIPR